VPTSLPSLAVWPTGLALIDACAYQNPPPAIATTAATITKINPRRFGAVEVEEDMAPAR
jgi:hypothetical protein